MFERDYLLKIIMQYGEALRRSWTKAKNECDPKGAAETIERAVGEAVEIDGDVLLSLSPESIASVMQVSGVDPRITEYIARSLLLTSSYLFEAGDKELAALREQQAYAIADAYELSIPRTQEEFKQLEIDAKDGFEGLFEKISNEDHVDQDETDLR